MKLGCFLNRCLPPQYQVLIGGFAIQLVLGTLYCWGNLTTYITSYLRQLNPELTYSDTLLVYASIIGTQALCMWAGGMVEEKLGPGLTTFLGGSILCGGIILSSLTTSLLGFVTLYGVCFGLGLALAYPCPLSCGFHWMPRHKGLVSGFIVSGFGGGPFVFNQVATRLVNPRDAPASEVGADGRLYYGPEVADRVPAMLRTLGAGYFALVLLGALALRDPPARRRRRRGRRRGEVASLLESVVTAADPGGGELLRQKMGTRTRNGAEEVGAAKIPRVCSIDAPRLLAAAECSPGELVREPRYYHLSLCFMLTAIGGLFIAGTYKTFGAQLKDDAYLSMVGSVASVANAAGRLMIWAPLCDRFGFQRALLVLTTCLASLLLTYPLSFSSPTLFMVWTPAIFLFSGGNYVVYPTATAQLFGVKHCAANYGLVWVVTGLTATIFITWLENGSGGGYQPIILGCMAAIGLVMAVLLNTLYFQKRKKAENEDPGSISHRGADMEPA
mmetsp:Transcript_4653/g.7730  ORF Transcript_4653/g.7730 Transcript_4653/m.7730 type:complete len:501 (-) Transcript_4653:96-1598(-)